MGASNKIQDTNLNITQFTCSRCCQPFTEQDKVNDNWELWWDTSNKVEVSSAGSWLRIIAYVRDITHRNHECAETERCRNCYNRFLKKKMEYVEYNKQTGQGDEYYCSPCYQQIKETKDHD